MNILDILNILTTKSINEHYAKRYIKFIQYCSTKVRKENEYTELHHILPRAKTQFPEYKSLKENSWNGIRLSAREHFIAHWLLWKSQGKFMAYSFKCMKRKNKYQSDRYFKITSKVYEQLKKDCAFAQSKRVILPETIEKMKKAKQNKLQCPHCSTIGDARNMRRWHFDNCKILTGKEKHDTNQNKTIVTCPHCGKSGKLQGMHSNHFDYCPLIFDRKIKDKVTCPHCNKSIANTKNNINLHFDNCPTFTGIKREQSENHKLANKARGDAQRGKPKPRKSKTNL